DPPARGAVAAVPQVGKPTLVLENDPRNHFLLRVVTALDRRAEHHGRTFDGENLRNSVMVAPVASDDSSSPMAAPCTPHVDIAASPNVMATVVDATYAQNTRPGGSRARRTSPATAVIAAANGSAPRIQTRPAYASYVPPKSHATKGRRRATTMT